MNDAELQICKNMEHAKDKDYDLYRLILLYY